MRNLKKSMLAIFVGIALCSSQVVAEYKELTNEEIDQLYEEMIASEKAELERLDKESQAAPQNSELKKEDEKKESEIRKRIENLNKSENSGENKGRAETTRGRNTNRVWPPVSKKVEDER